MAVLDNLHKLIINYLPNTFTEQDVLNLFSVFGKVHSCKLMIDMKTGGSKGWCFVNYFEIEDAQRALKAYDGLKIQNKVIRVSFAGEKAGSKAQLFISGLKKDLTEEELRNLFSTYGVVDWCYIMPKGAALLRFEKREDASKAISELNGKTVSGHPYPLKVSWHESSRKRDKVQNDEEATDFVGKAPSSAKVKLNHRFTPIAPPILSNNEVSTLYVSGIPEDFTEGKLYKMFSPYGAISKATVLMKPETNVCKGVAFVDMVNREDAVSAIQSLHGVTMNDREIRVQFKTKKPK